MNKIFLSFIFLIPTSYALDESRLFNELEFLRTIPKKEIVKKEEVQIEAKNEIQADEIENLEEEYFNDSIETKASGIKRSR